MGNNTVDTKIKTSKYPIIFIGAGPGDPELITVKGKNALNRADIIIYAGSLVPEAVLKWTQSEALKISSAPLNLEEVLDIMLKAYEEGKKVVRLHSGDPSMYGAIYEQIAVLENKSIPCEIIPGVTAAFAAAAASKMEYTIPGISQTLILTRMSGRTKVPESESLKDLAAHRSSMAIYLSISLAKETKDILMDAYGPDAPAIIAYKVSHPDQKIIHTKIKNIVKTLKKEGISKQALIIVGNATNVRAMESFEKSQLYNKEFSHNFRK